MGEMSEENSIKKGDTVRCHRVGGQVLPEGLPVNARAEVMGVYVDKANASIVYVSYENRVFKLPGSCVLATSFPTFIAQKPGA